MDMDKALMWKKIRNLLAVLFAIGFWILSMVFSQMGFGIEVAKWAWAGWILAGGVTVLELVLNSGERLPTTLYAVGILAYLYGVVSNVAGLLSARIGTTTSDGLDWAFAIIVGLVIEVVPEPLFLYGLGVNLGDLITTLMGGQSVRNNGRGSQIRMSEQRFRPQEADFSESRTESVQTDIPVRADKSTGQTTRMVREYCFRHRNPDGTAMSVRDVATAIGKDKSTVGAIMAEMRKRGEIK